MSEKKRTRHECPICKEIIYNDVATFHEHLNSVCAEGLFSKYPGLKSEKFNNLWYKLESMVAESIIIPSGQQGIMAIIHESQQPLPSYYNYPHHQQPRYQQYHHQQYHHQQQRRMDLEDIDRDIEQRERNRINQRKRRRQEMEKEIFAELKDDEFNKSMPKMDELNKNKPNEAKKRRLLYHNTSNIRPPKRVNIDPAISMNLFQHKIRETRRLYHNVSYHDFINDDDKSNQFKNVDQHSAIIHTQNALNRYLLNSQVLRKCFNGKLFEKISKKFEKIYGKNYENIMMAILNEINVWQNFENEENQENEENMEKNEKEENDALPLKKEKFLSNWDAIPQQTLQYHLDKLLETEDLTGIYSKCHHSFWNSSNNVKHGGFDKSIFDNAQNKKFIKL